jgi:DNA-binding transcriptional MocR family regulator
MTDPFTFQTPARLIDFMREAGEPGLINLAAGVPATDSLPAAELGKAFSQAFAREGTTMWAYHHPEGDPALRELLAARLRTRGANVTGKQVLTVTGCQQGLQLMLAALVRPGDIVACEVPAYYALLELISAAGARILPLPIRSGDGIDLAETAARLARWKPRVLFVCSSLSNPSSATMPAKNREQLVALCRQHGVRLVEDDIYGELVDGGALPTMLAHDDGTTVSYVSSFSKSVSPGLRAGVCIAGSLHEQVATLKCQQDMHSAVPGEVMLRYFLEMDALDPHLERLRTRNVRRRAFAADTIQRTFPKGTRLWPQIGGYMVWLELPGLCDFAQVRAAARARNVVFAAGDVFFPAAPGTSYLRLNCARASEPDLIQGLEILGGILCGSD